MDDFWWEFGFNKGEIEDVERFKTVDFQFDHSGSVKNNGENPWETAAGPAKCQRKSLVSRLQGVLEAPPDLLATPNMSHLLDISMIFRKIRDLKPEEIQNCPNQLKLTGFASIVWISLVI